MIILKFEVFKKFTLLDFIKNKLNILPKNTHYEKSSIN